jgi:hypothetical protein
MHSASTALSLARRAIAATKAKVVFGCERAGFFGWKRSVEIKELTRTKGPRDAER